MEDLTNLTPTELLKRINDTKDQHERLKKEIVDYTIEVDELEKKINGKIAELVDAEKFYIALIEEMEKK
jgi:uncharacterized coiled-coil DUF342 family protein